MRPPGTSGDGRLERRVLSGWGRATASSADVAPVTESADVSRILRWPGPRGALARGLGRSYGDAAQNAGGVVLDMNGLRQPVVVDGGRLTVGAGTSIRDVHRAIVPTGWMLPVVPGTESVTMGGALAADVHGKNHPRDGSFATHVERFLLATCEGEREIDARRDPDDFWATAGGMGLTGVITRLTVRLRPIETPMMMVRTRRHGGIDAVLTDLGGTDHHYAAAWIDATAGGRHLGRGVVSTAEHALGRDLPGRASEAGRHRDRPSPEIPPLPVSLVRRGPVRLANVARYHATRTGERLEPYARVLHPLDGLAEWHRLYGRRGMVQHQMAVPDGREDVVVAMLEELARRRVLCSLAVLKRFGPGDAGPLSFPIEGWTLALDLPRNQPGLASLLAGFDGRVIEAGGRVYLAKDACAAPAAIEAMYPRLPAWRAVRDRVDPGGIMQSDLSRRLGLTARRDGR
jgi:decaprenylphospho-beta-D-ribofuranose 2-oxidase